MNKNIDIDTQADTEKPGLKPSALDLRGRQSVRATFRLSEDCIDAISILSAQLGIKQKSVFDHLMEDALVLKKMASELENVKELLGTEDLIVDKLQAAISAYNNGYFEITNFIEKGKILEEFSID